MRFDGKRGFPIEGWAFRRDFRKRFVNKMMHNATCLVNAMLNERRTDQRFDDIAQNRAFISAALIAFAMTEQNVRACIELFASDFAQGFLGNGFRAHFRKLPLVHVGVCLVQGFRGDELKHGVAKEFQTFVVFCARILVREGAVGERFDQQIGFERGAKCFKQRVGGHLAFGNGGCVGVVLGHNRPRFRSRYAVAKLAALFGTLRTWQQASESGRLLCKQQSRSVYSPPMSRRKCKEMRGYSADAILGGCEVGWSGACECIWPSAQPEIYKNPATRRWQGFNASCRYSAATHLVWMERTASRYTRPR